MKMFCQTETAVKKHGHLEHLFFREIPSFWSYLNPSDCTRGCRPCILQGYYYSPTQKCKKTTNYTNVCLQHVCTMAFEELCHSLKFFLKVFSIQTEAQTVFTQNKWMGREFDEGCRLLRCQCSRWHSGSPLKHWLTCLCLFLFIWLITEETYLWNFHKKTNKQKTNILCICTLCHSLSDTLNTMPGEKLWE